MNHRRSHKLPNSVARLLALLGLLGSVGALGSAQAQVAVFSTLGSGNTYDASGGQFIIGSDTGFQSIANAFAPTLSGDLLSIELGISRTDDGANGQFVVELRLNDPAMNRPGMILASGELTTLTTIGFSNSDLTTFTYSGPSIALVAGQTYWIALTPQNPSTSAIWNFNSTGRTGSVTSSSNGTTYNPPFTGSLSAFQINAVPEPSTCALCLSGALLFLGARRFRGRR